MTCRGHSLSTGRTQTPSQSAVASMVEFVNSSHYSSEAESPLADDQNANIALLIANTVSKEVSSSLAGLLREVEVRLTTVINNLATGIQEQQRGELQRSPTHHTFNFASEVSKGGREQEFASMARSQRGHERPSPKPQWLEKSLASGKVSMQDLENDHANHLLEARLTEDMVIGRAARSGSQRRWRAAASAAQKKPASHLRSHDEDGTAAADGLSKGQTDTFDAPHLSESSAATRNKSRGSQSYAAQVAQALSIPRMLPFGDARPSDASDSSNVQHEVSGPNGSRSRSQQEGVSDARQHRLPSAARRFRVTHPEPEGNAPPPVEKTTAEKQGSRPSFEPSDGSLGEALPPPDLTAGPEAAEDGAAGTNEQAGDRQAAPTPERSGRRFPSIWSPSPLWSTSETTLPVEEVRLGEGPISYVSRQILSSRKEFSDIMPGGTASPQDSLEPDSFVTNKKSESFASNKKNESFASNMNPPPGSITPSPSLQTLPAFDVARVWDEENTTCRQLLCPPSSLAMFRGLVLAACVCVALFCIRQHLDVADRWEDPEVDPTLLLLRLLDLLIALGSLLCFPAGWRVRKYKLLVHTEHLLGRFTYRKKMVDALRTTSVRRWYTYLFLWLLSLSIRFLAELDSYQMSWPGPTVGRHAAVCLRVSMFAVSSGVLVWCMHSLDHLCRIMVMMVDAFCFYCAHSSVEVDTLVDDWNILQALLRHTAGTCEASILVVLATVSAALVTAILGPMQAATPEPRTFWVLAILGPLVMLSGGVLMKAAQVTEKCKRVPSVANSMIFRFQMGDRFYLTHYISWSNAGFYVREVLVNGIMVLKVSHLGFLAVFAVFSRLLAMG